MKNKSLLLIAIFAISTLFIGCNADIDSPDLTKPTVESTSPSASSTNASINGAIHATFNVDMDAATINDTTFTVSLSNTEIDGTVTYDIPNKKATFSPTTNLAYSTEYDVKLTTGVKSIANVAMTVDKEWSFTTSADGIGPPPVNLGTAANYVILAKTAISTVPASVITGDIGLSPAAETYITGFSQTDATGYATSDQVTGFIYAADMVSPTSSNLTTAVENMITAYNDAAGRITPDYENLGAGEIGSKTLTPGLYKWTSSVTINSNVTISGTADDTWIFQIEGDLSIGSNFQVILSGGAQAKNIVWQVAGEVSMGTGSHFEGVVLTQTKITMNTGSSINGRLLAQTQVALDQSTVTKPAL